MHASKSAHRRVTLWLAATVGVAARRSRARRSAGQFAIATRLCAEPRVDPLLSVTYAYLEKGKVVQAISGPYDLGRPNDCKRDALSGFDRLHPKPVAAKKGAKRTPTSKRESKKR